MPLFAFIFASVFSWSVAHAHDHQSPGTAHLKFMGGSLHAHALWVQGPQTPDESILKIEWKNGADHSPTEPPGSFDVQIVMPSMEHEFYPPTDIKRLMGPDGNPLLGQYEVKNIYFFMGGKWDVNVVLKLQDGSEETQTIKVDLGEDDGGHHH